MGLEELEKMLDRFCLEVRFETSRKPSLYSRTREYLDKVRIQPCTELELLDGDCKALKMPYAETDFRDDEKHSWRWNLFIGRSLFPASSLCWSRIHPSKKRYYFTIL